MIKTYEMGKVYVIDVEGFDHSTFMPTDTYINCDDGAIYELLTPDELLELIPSGYMCYECIFMQKTVVIDVTVTVND